MKVDCVDISTWNSGVNYNAVKADGIVAAILRAGYGREVSQKDSQFETHYRGCRNAGIKVGIYWYSYADGVGDRPARLFRHGGSVADLYGQHQAHRNGKTLLRNH